ncbi:hypothetical protein [Micromonospora siamensis]|uniref:Winged helix DNA-binding domain-containing protein n=1 Tax=Micromonospora siamensis TaxID=299152 RepID=A0A1C5IIG1_9ACTN|nr:hypothetical protein [Micromonospora siamensis]SCG58064.1 hypothetical protein GA0074704_3459 [Micromonospora siamensis]
MSTPPLLNGQVLGQAHHATRAVLERELTAVGISFPQSVALNLVAAEGGATPRAALVAAMTVALKAEEPLVTAAIEELLAAGLLAGGRRLALTADGRGVHERVRAAVSAITTRLYADIPAHDMAVAGRVLDLVRRRADAELAGAGR